MDLAKEAREGSRERAPLDVPITSINIAEREMQYQPLQGKFNSPVNRFDAAEVLREEERKNY